MALWRATASYGELRLATESYGQLRSTKLHKAIAILELCYIEIR
ncbi:hypothetical protein PIIN_11167 [Serendipita indica DSM 11827]|uniref:Uncharacterized protein n=1 Tax=Serendipita indica (strain DSM 11827) TaxID=1109443 RepID=G4U0U2_SERID|nr:hypothetical protein PIIN_11167 [Serendipita indica DSM 11827]